MNAENIQGSVDLLTSTEVKGWALRKDFPGRRMVVVVESQNGEVARGLADQKRADLELAKIGDGNCAFSLRIEKPEDVLALQVLAEDPVSKERFLIPRRGQIDAAAVAKCGYQSFNDQKGDSNSPAKLAALRLPLKLDGKTVLDIGCNEGFFCLEAHRRGAARVVGIDSNPEVIRRAKARDTKTDYHVGSWWDLPEETFDLILFLSAIHYEHRQKELLNYLSSKLKPGGVLVLECGVSSKPGKQWCVARRHDGFLRFPTWDLLIEELLSGWVVTPMGSSVAQSGDPMPRSVFHCSAVRPTYLMVCGKPGDGKTNLARLLTLQTRCRYSTDEFFYSIVQLSESDLRGDEFLTKVRRECDVMKLDEFVGSLVVEGMSNQFARRFLERAPLEGELVVLEGQALTFPEVEAALTRELETRGGLVWKVTRTRSE